MPDELSDRFDASRYSEDEEASFSLRLDPRAGRVVPLDLLLSERLLHRLRHLGLAYEMPLLSRLPASGKWFYPEEQIDPLSDEIAFVLRVVDDPLLTATLAELSRILQPRGRSRLGWQLRVEAP
ncbi:MAG: hypothetical protein V4850_14365 [Myxococcota bacterium]